MKKARVLTRALLSLLAAAVASSVLPVAAANADWSPNPFGAFDSATRVPGGIRVRGWGIDASNGSASVPVHVYMDGQHVASGSADKPRPDVANAYPFGSNHGFDITFAAPAGTHQVCVNLLNIGAGTANPRIGCVSAGVSNVPHGTLDAVGRVSGGVQMVGWVIDPDVAKSIAVHAYVDGKYAGAATASVTRNDVAAVYPDYGPAHGFDFVVPADNQTHEVCVYPINEGPGYNRKIGCLAVDSAARSPVPDAVVKYAPVFVFHPTESYWPSSAQQFINGSALFFNHDARCPNSRVVAGGAVSGAALATGTYGARQKNGLCRLYGNTYRTNQLTRPNGPCSSARPSDLECDEGFYLDLSSGLGAGNASTKADSYQGTASAIYYYYVPGKYIRYWIFFPGSRAGADLGGMHVHEGDWEGITIRLGPSNTPTAVHYSQHYVVDKVAWADVPKSGGTHPVAYVAKGSHASYRSAGCATSNSFPKAGPKVDDCGTGRRWYTWKTGNGGLRDATWQTWYGFGGAWGAAGNTSTGTGPLGPSAWNRGDV